MSGDKELRLQALALAVQANPSHIVRLAEEFVGFVQTGYPKRLDQGGYTVIGPEAFTDGQVISYKGENYYRACGIFVHENADGSRTHCVRRTGHPGDLHEDYDGCQRSV